MTEPDEPFLLKNLFDIKSVGAIGDAVRKALPAFDRPVFMAQVSTMIGLAASSSSACGT